MEASFQLRVGGLFLYLEKEYHKKSDILKCQVSAQRATDEKIHLQLKAIQSAK